MINPSHGKTSRPSLKFIYINTFRLFKANPKVYIPYLISIAVESAALLVIFLVPREPLNTILGPIIGTFWGEKYLHYPVNFLILPKLLDISRMMLSIFIGCLLNATFVAMILDIDNKKPVNFAKALGSVIKKYASLFIIYALVNCVLFLSSKILVSGLIRYFSSGHAKLLFIGPGFWLGPAFLTINIAINIFIQSIFIYAIPCVVVNNNKLIASLKNSFVFFTHHLFLTFILVGLPIVLYLPVGIFLNNPGTLIEAILPESVLVMCYISILVNYLVIDPLITASSTVVFLAARNE